MKCAVVLVAGLLLAASILPAPAEASGFGKGNAVVVVAPARASIGPRFFEPRFFTRSVPRAFVAGRPLSFGNSVVFGPQFHRGVFVVPQGFVAPSTNVTVVQPDPEATPIVTPLPTMQRCVSIAGKWTCARVPARSVVTFSG